MPTRYQQLENRVAELERKLEELAKKEELKKDIGQSDAKKTEKRPRKKALNQELTADDWDKIRTLPSLRAGLQTKLVNFFFERNNKPALGMAIDILLGYPNQRINRWCPQDCGNLNTTLAKANLPYRLRVNARRHGIDGTQIPYAFCVVK